jgi:hypothetical protein
VVLSGRKLLPPLLCDQPIVLKAINNGLAGADPQFKIDGGEILRGKEQISKTVSLGANGQRRRLPAVDPLVPALAKVWCFGPKVDVSAPR